MNSLFMCTVLSIILGLGQTLPQATLLLNSRGLYSDQNTCTSGSTEIVGCNADCTGLKKCAYGEIVIIDCYTQTGKPYCNQATNQCESTATMCPAPDATFQCPESSGVFPDPLDCTQFHICQYYIPTHRQCLHSLFNPSAEKCDVDIVCYSFSSTYGLCKGKTGMMVAHPTVPKLFAYCAADYPILGSCKENNYFDTKSLSCQYNCTSSGVFPDVHDLQSFYVCTQYGTGFTVIHDTCRDGKLFCEEHNDCL